MQGFKEVAAQERKVIAAEKDVHEIRQPTISFDVIFFIIDLFWPNASQGLKRAVICLHKILLLSFIEPRTLMTPAIMGYYRIV